MFLFGLLGLAAIGGAAYAMSDVLSPSEEDETDTDVIDDEEIDDLSQGNLLEIDDVPSEGNLVEPVTATATDEIAPEDSATNAEETPSAGTVLSDYDGNLVIAGTEGDDVLAGGTGNDQINGYGGDDTVEGGDGDDVLFGDQGADRLTGGAGDDTLHGQDDDDTLDGGTGDDRLFGHYGDDRLTGGSGADKLYGGQGDDGLVGDAGEDSLQGGDGDDHLSGGAGEDALFGGDGDDTLDGSDGEDTPDTDFLNGGAGDDTILAGPGDIATGGAGSDTFIFDGAPDGPEVTVMDFAHGQDKLLVSWDQPEAPEISIEQDADNPDMTQVLVNGQLVAQLLDAEGLTLDDIELVSTLTNSQSTATG